MDEKNGAGHNYLIMNDLPHPAQQEKVYAVMRLSPFE
jgi:hypothetical protein